MSAMGTKGARKTHGQRWWHKDGLTPYWKCYHNRLVRRLVREFLREGEQPGARPVHRGEALNRCW